MVSTCGLGCCPCIVGQKNQNVNTKITFLQLQSLRSTSTASHHWVGLQEGVSKAGPAVTSSVISLFLHVNSAVFFPTKLPVPWTHVIKTEIAFSLQLKKYLLNKNGRKNGMK